MKQNDRKEREMTNEERAVIEAAASVIVCKENFYFQLKALKQLESALCALENATPPAPEPETREVRIAVAIDTNGNHGVLVVLYEDDAETLECVHEWTDSVIVAQGIVTARIPVIAVPVVPGTVEAV